MVWFMFFGKGGVLLFGGHCTLVFQDDMEGVWRLRG